jgi:hypothetical protein
MLKGGTMQVIAAADTTDMLRHMPPPTMTEAASVATLSKVGN